MGRLINEIGNEYGKLKVISRGEDSIHNGGKRVEARWNCECKCGKFVLARGSDLRQYRYNSCGCHKGLDRYKGYNDLSSTYICVLKKHAKDLDMEYSLSMEYLWDLLVEQEFRCAITGIAIKLNRNYAIEKYKNQTASLDRIDSKKPYIIGNVWWVHKEINKLKVNFGLDRFIELCELVAKNKDKCYEQFNSRNLQNRECSASQQ